jgi:Predicted pyridoxal phosphate-dependent enzyme apparently involved in regulation of cell wall biogenesis
MNKDASLRVIPSSARESIYVTQPHMPPRSEFIPHLENTCDSKALTNEGPFPQQLEKVLGEYLGVQHLSLFVNGTPAPATALRITGEVITTPYSFVATVHSLLWNGIKPLFVDVGPNTLNLGPSKIKAAITPQATAIQPSKTRCDVEAHHHVRRNLQAHLVRTGARRKLHRGRSGFVHGKAHVERGVFSSSRQRFVPGLHCLLLQ